MARSTAAAQHHNCCGAGPLQLSAPSRVRSVQARAHNDVAEYHSDVAVYHNVAATKVLHNSSTEWHHNAFYISVFFPIGKKR